MKQMFPAFLILAIVGVAVFSVVILLPETEVGELVEIPSSPIVQSPQAVETVETVETQEVFVPTETPTTVDKVPLTRPTLTPVPTFSSEQLMRTDLLIDGNHFAKILAKHLTKYPNATGPVYPCSSLPGFVPRLVLEDWVKSWRKYSPSGMEGKYNSESEYCLSGSIVALSNCDHIEGLEASEISFRFRAEDMCYGNECNAVGALMYKVSRGGFSNSYSGKSYSTTYVYTEQYTQMVPNKELYCSNTMSQYANGFFEGSFPQDMDGYFAIITFFKTDMWLMRELDVPYISLHIAE